MFTIFQGTPCKPARPFRFPLFQGKHVFTLRSLAIPDDMHLIHRWTQLEYARRFWQMDMPVDTLCQWYFQMISRLDAHPYLGLLDGKPVCQLDVYRAFGEEISLHYPAGTGDYGIHLLMCPNRKNYPDLTVQVLRAALKYLFSFSEVENVIGEPDIQNRAANLVIRRAGFQLVQQVRLSDKQANLFLLRRSHYLETCTVSHELTGKP
ncbi:MAG TPA: GNAT family N-acetyltransferase [Chitinophagaceae bacterium]|nr:GNAT family N-acetyltransferase [Chitinophagaceae bacterium]